MHTETRNGVLYVAGDITVKTLSQAAFARFREQCRLKEVLSLDFSEVGRADSACVSLLLEAIRLKQTAAAFTGLPQSVAALCSLYELQDTVAGATPVSENP